jgi:DeoR family transcriptional regulator, aga operon transcriptional repressor
MAGIIWDEGFARVTDLAGRFGVSAVTVRADLTALEARARVRRVRGGAVPPSGLLGERPFESSKWEAPLQKSSIGVHAAGMIAAGDTVILDVGTTTTAIARALVLRTELHDVTASAFETPGLARLPGLDPERAYRVEPAAVAGEAETKQAVAPA